MKNKCRANEKSANVEISHSNFWTFVTCSEIDFNDIRTTLQALYAIYDNCNSLHTNTYDKAIYDSTEESVRRAITIQLIINKRIRFSENEKSNPKVRSLLKNC